MHPPSATIPAALSLPRNDSSSPTNLRGPLNFITLQDDPEIWRVSSRWQGVNHDEIPPAKHLLRTISAVGWIVVEHLRILRTIPTNFAAPDFTRILLFRQDFTHLADERGDGDRFWMRWEQRHCRNENKRKGKDRHLTDINLPNFAENPADLKRHLSRSAPPPCCWMGL